MKFFSLLLLKSVYLLSLGLKTSSVRQSIQVTFNLTTSCSNITVISHNVSAFTNPHWLKLPADQAQRSACRVEDLASAGLSAEFSSPKILLADRGRSSRCLNAVLCDVESCSLSILHYRTYRAPFNLCTYDHYPLSFTCDLRLTS